MREFYLKTIQYISLSLRRERAGVRVDNDAPPTSILPRKGGGGPWGCPICNSRGLSVLFLVIAMMLMVSIGYVLSYLIPTKQKSVKFQIYSNQAFFIAQSGVEFATRYCSDRGWRGTTDGGRLDIDRLNDAGNNQRYLGSGRFTINYSPATDMLTSTGEITNSTERRIVRVSNFDQFLRLNFIIAPIPTNSPPHWCRGTRRARFFITNVRNTNVVLQSFRASWTQTGVARRITRIDMDGVQKYAGAYSNEGAPQNLNRPLPSPSQTIIPNDVITVLIYWSGNVANGEDILITFYTGLLGAGEVYTFNLDSASDFIPNRTVFGMPGC